MKLFQQMLVAGASLSLLAPVASQASDVVNIEEMNSYARSQSKSSRIDSKTFINEVSEDIAILKGRVDGLEAQQNNLEAGAFSQTTSMDGKAVFTVGAVDYSLASETASEATQAMYTYTMNLNSSFTGDDNLYVRIKTGNHTDWSKTKTYGTYLSSANSNGGELKVDKIWYQFPVGDKNTVWVGPQIENYYMHGTTPSIYKPVTKQFTLGGNGEAYGASTDTGAGWAYKADNGFAVSSNIGTKSTTTTSGTNTGLLTNESKTSWATQVGYTKPNYSVSALLNIKSNGWSDTYYHTADHGTGGNGNFSSVGLRGWWRPDNTGTATPSISVGFDTTEYDGAPSSTSNSTAYFVGLNWQDMFQADDRIGIAFGQPTTNESESVDPFAYEVYYSFNPNDSVTVTPAVFGGTDRNGTSGADIFGAVVETTFKF
ncbi:MAG: carbohydrate porin [Prochlorococcus marinus CUG1437]|nr:carbohydrate porin [Prochlorococcus marinus CUG1437]